MVSSLSLFLLLVCLLLVWLSVLSVALGLLHLLPARLARTGAVIPALALVMLLSPFPSMAALRLPAASGSDAEELTVPEEELTHPEDEEVDYYPTAITIADGDYTLDYLYEYFKGKVISDVASSSDALAAPQAQVESTEPDPFGAVDSGEYILADAVSYALESQTDFVNAVRYDCTLAGRSATLLFPSGSESYLFIDSQKQLWNMSNNTIQGVVIYDSVWDPTADEGTLVYLTPCLGNNFSANHEGQSPNYIRRYYWERSNYGNRLTYNTTYVAVTVTDSPFPFVVKDIPLYVIILLIGGVLLCLLKKSLR